MNNRARSHSDKIKELVTAAFRSKHRSTAPGIKPITLPLFGSWGGLKTGFMTWFVDASMHNPHVADLAIDDKTLKLHFAANADIVIQTLDLTRGFVVTFTHHPYGDGTSEVNVHVHHPRERTPTVAFKSLWPTDGVRGFVPQKHEWLPFLSPFELSRVLQMLKDLAHVYGVGWDNFTNARVERWTLFDLKSQGEAINDPGAWQSYLANPDAQSKPVSLLGHH